MKQLRRKLSEVKKTLSNISKTGWDWQTDEKGRKFIYIKPEQIREYEERGWRIERGPRGGIRAYPPANRKQKLSTEDVKSILREKVKEMEQSHEGMKSEEYKTLRAILKALEWDNDVDLARVLSIKGYLSGVLSGKDVDMLAEALFNGYDEMVEWLQENVIEVEPDDDFLKAFSNVVVRSEDGRLFVLYPEFRKVFWSFARREGAGTEGVGNLVLLGNEEAVKSRLVRFKGFLKKAGIRGKLYDKVLKEVKEYFKELEGGMEILKYQPKGIFNRNSFDYSKVDELRESVNDSFRVRGKVFSLALLVEDRVKKWKDLDRSSGADIILYVKELYKLFKDLGIDDDVAKGLAKGWEVMRLWGSEMFVYYTNSIENLIVSIRGNHRDVRQSVEPESKVVADEVKPGLMFLEKYADVKSVQSWAEFNRGYLKHVYGSNKIKVYRGVKAWQALEMYVNYLRTGRIRVGGVLDSFTDDWYVAGSFVDDYDVVIEAEVPLDLVWGSYLNASQDMAVSEREITIEKPQGGLRVDGIVTTSVVKDLFRGNVRSALRDRKAELEEFLRDGLDGLARVYGRDSKKYQEVLSVVKDLASRYNLNVELEKELKKAGFDVRERLMEWLAKSL